MFPSTPIESLQHRISELLPDLDLSDNGMAASKPDHSRLQDEAKQQSDVYTVSTYLRRIFSKIAKLESPAAAEARREIRNYAAAEGIDL